MRKILPFAIQVSATVAVLGFLAGIAVPASMSGWLPFDWFVGDVNPNRLGMLKAPVLPSELGIWVMSLGVACFMAGTGLTVCLAIMLHDEHGAAADRP